MDVGVKLEGDFIGWCYDVVFYLVDDWGIISIDIMDDNGYWGSFDMYCKV